MMDADSFNFTAWASENGLKQEAIAALTAEDFDNYEMLYMLSDDDIKEIAQKVRTFTHSNHVILA